MKHLLSIKPDVLKRVAMGSSAFFFLSGTYLNAQTVASEPLRIPSSEVSFLTIAPDARSSGTGGAGIASSPDANSAFWNASKLAFATKDFGASASYTRWMPRLTNDVWIGYASAYKKLGDRQALGISLNYYDQGIFSLGTTTSPQPIQPVRSRDYVVNISYARQLSRNFSVGATLKYINSERGLEINIYPAERKPARVLAADLSALYRKQTINQHTGREVTLSVGASISNLGGKIDYGLPSEPQFIPTNLKIGGGLSYTATGLHRFNFVLDASKLMVPTPISGNAIAATSVVRGVLNSFSDAPGGFKEEMQEVTLSGGMEYWYKNRFALRGGYLAENKYKGDRKHFTAGAGARFLKNYELDFAYALPAKKDSPLAQTFRITASVYLGKKA